jgi:hypothetical protein
MWFDGRGNNEETGHRTDCGILWTRWLILNTSENGV